MDDYFRICGSKEKVEDEDMTNKGKAGLRWLALALLATALMVLLACPALAADSRVTVTPSSTELTPGDGVVLMINAPGAQALRLYQEVDGVTLEEYREFDGEKAMWRDHQVDSRTYYATACFDGVWSEPSEKVLVSVAYEGVLAAPVVTVPENAQAGETLTFAWSSVENAEEYNIQLTRDDGEWLCYRYTEGETSLSLPFLWQAGNYTISVTPWKENWDDTKATGSADFTVTGAMEAAPEITFDALEAHVQEMIYCTATKPGATKFQIEYENEGWTDELVAVNGTATGEYGAWDYGEARFRATAYVDGAWTAWSDWATVDVVPLGTIADPAPTAVVSEDGQVTIEWPMVEHSISYEVTVFDSVHFRNLGWWNGYFDETTGDTASVTLDSVPLPAGEYMAIVHLYAFSDDYKCESDGACLFTLTHELAPAPEVTVEEDQVLIGNSAHVTIAAEGMEKVMVRENGGFGRLYTVSESPWTYDAYGYSPCRNTYEFSACVNGAWTEWSEPVTITFYSYGKIGTPVITVPETLEAGNDLTISWTPVENVYHYSIWMFSESTGYPQWTCSADQTSFTIPATLEPDTYTVCVQGYPMAGWEYGSDARATVTVSGDMAAGPLVTADREQTGIGQNVSFAITAPGATQLRCHYGYVGWYENWVNFDANPDGDVTTFEWNFWDEGTVKVSFSACVDGLWTAMSEPVTITVTQMATLDTPVIHMEESMVAGGQLPLTIDEVPNATDYYVELLRDGQAVEGVYLSLTENRETLLRGPLAPGTYEVKVTACAQGWNSSSVSRTLTVTGELAQGPEIIASQTEGTPDTSFTLSAHVPGATKYFLYTEKYNKYGNRYATSCLWWEEPSDDWQWTTNFDLGSKVIRLSAMVNGLWTAYSDPITVTISEMVVSTSNQPKAAENFTIYWTPVSGADSYSVRIVMPDGTDLVYVKNLAASTTSFEYTEGKLGAGPYIVYVVASGSGIDPITATTALMLGEPDPDKAFTYYNDSNTYAWIDGYLGSAPTELVIPETIDGLTVNAISGFGLVDMSQLKRITIPASVNSIQKTALSGCTDLTIVGYSGSAAESFALLNGYTFESLGSVVEGISVSWDKENVFVNQETVFTITAPGAMGFGERVDGITEYDYGTKSTRTETGGLYRLTFTETGTHIVQFIVYLPDKKEWVDSGIYTVEVKAVGKALAPTNIAAVGDTFYTGDAITFTWDAVEGATGYNVGLGTQGCDTDQITLTAVTDTTWTTAEADLPNAAGEYEFVVQTIGSTGYANSDFVRYPVTVVPRSEFDYLASEQAIVGYFGDETDIVIPSVIDGVQITKIGDHAFDENNEITEKSITSVVISEGITSLGNSAFYGCRNLQNVVLPSTLTSIGDWAFNLHPMYPTGLTSLVIPASVTYMSPYALAYQGTTIYGYTGTAAESYATANNLTFVALDGQTAADATFTLAQQTVYLNGNVTLNVTAPDAQKLRVYVDGVALTDEVAVVDGVAAINVPMKALGQHTVTVAQYALGVWQEPCAAQIVTVLERPSVTLTPESQIMIPGERRMISVIVTNMDQPEGYTWSSSNEAVATVANDVVTAVGVGTAIITVSAQMSDGTSIEGTCEVEVRDLSMLDLPDALTTIEAEAFLASPAQCVVLESTVATVGERAFANSAELQLVIVKGVNTTFASDAFSGCGNVAIACVENSAAHTFAQSNGIPCFFIAD